MILQSKDLRSQMCMIQTYDVIYPDGDRRTSEQLVNCERGTRSQPCTNTSHEPYFHERDATPEEIHAAHLERHPNIAPSSSERPRTHRQSRDKPKGFLGFIDRLFGMNVRTSPRKHHETEPQRFFVRNRRRLPRPNGGRAENRQPVPVHPPPRAPTPPVYPPPPPSAPPSLPTSPMIVPIEPPQEHRSRRQEYHPRGRRPTPQEREMEREPRRRTRRSVVVHQSSSEEDSPSPPTASRRHQRRTRSLSPRSRYEEEKRATRERERQAHADRLARIARLEQEARDRAVRLAEDERRNRHPEFGERRSIESAGRARRRRQQEEEERYRRREARRRQNEEERSRRRDEARRCQEEEERSRRRDEARRLQEEADIRRLDQQQDRMAEQERLGRARRANIPRQPRHQPTVHGESLDARGDRFIREAITAENPPAAYRRYDGGFLGRRNTVDGSQRRRRRWEDPQW